MFRQAGGGWGRAPSRGGGKSLGGLGGKWKDVDNAFRHWAERLRMLLAAQRGK